MEGPSQHHVCNVCGEWFEEALALLAHAELHARYYSLKIFNIILKNIWRVKDINIGNNLMENIIFVCV